MLQTSDTVHTPSGRCKTLAAKIGRRRRNQPNDESSLSHIYPSTVTATNRTRIDNITPTATVKKRSDENGSFKTTQKNKAKASA